MFTSINRKGIARFAAILLALSTAIFGTANAAERYRPENNRWKPSTVFLQSGTGDNQTSAYALGATWNWHWGRNFRFGYVTGYTEAAVGRWNIEHPAIGQADYATQFGITPVLRLFPAGLDGRWFSEIGVGANYIAPLFHTDGRRFSTQFNFGDHIAFGRILDTEGRSSVAIRLQHFSNGGIDAPNPGQNFGQLRFSYHY